MDKKLLTTGDIAKYCGVNLRTVIRWIKRGHLKAIQLPGRGDNRIEQENFLEFLKVYHMEIPEDFKVTPAAEPQPKQDDEKRILIVDDEQHIAMAIQRVLRLKGMTTQIALNGFMAGTRLYAFKPHLMTLDIMMPGMDGHEVIKIVRADPVLKDVKILVISAAPQASLSLALELGADAVLEKPFDNALLVDKVNALLDLSNTNSTHVT